MTQTYLLPIRTAALLFPLLAMLMFVPTAIVLYRRHGVMTRWRVLSLYGGVYYALSAFCTTIMPLPKSSVNVCTTYPAFAEPQLTPGVAFADVWKEAHHHVTLDALVLHNPAFWQTVFNLLLLLPLGLFVRVHFRRGLTAATAVGFAASLFFELTQYTGLWGLYACPYRLFAVDDLIVNTAGAALGWVLAGPLARALPRLNALDDRALAPGRVPFGRRLVALLLDVTGVVVLAPAIGVVVSVLLGAGAVPWVLPVAFVLWFVVIPWRTGATPGKHVLLLRLVTPEGGRPGPALLLLRAVTLSPVLALAYIAATTPLAASVGAALSASRDSPSRLAETVGQLNYRTVAYNLAADPVYGLVLLLPPAVCLFLIGAYARAVWRHPLSLGPHETLSGIRNQALPPRRTRTRTQTPTATTPAAPTSSPAPPHRPGTAPSPGRLGPNTDPLITTSTPAQGGRPSVPYDGNLTAGTH